MQQTTKALYHCTHTVISSELLSLSITWKTQLSATKTLLSELYNLGKKLRMKWRRLTERLFNVFPNTKTKGREQIKKFKKAF